MPEYIKTNRAGYSLDEAIEHTNSKNAIIVKYVNGVRTEYIEWNPSTESMFNPRIDPRYFRKEKLVTRSGEEIRTKELPSDMLTAGVNPFVQIIYKIVKRGGITSFEDIVRSVLTEERVFPSDETSIGVIEGIISWMNDGSTPEGSKDEEGGPYYLLLHNKKLKIGFDIPKFYNLVKYEKGYDPFEYQIVRIAKNRELISRSEIYEYITEYLAWMKSLEKVDYYIHRLLEKGVLQQVQKNYFRFIKPLESYK